MRARTRLGLTGIGIISLGLGLHLAGVGIAGILGLPVLGQGKLTIDYRNGTVRFDYKN